MMTILWRLRTAMVEKNIHSMAELARQMQQLANYPISEPALYRLNKIPAEIKFATLDALLRTMGYSRTDFGIFTFDPGASPGPPLIINDDPQLDTHTPHPKVHRIEGIIKDLPPTGM